MNTTKSEFSITSTQMAYWLSISFLIFMCIFFLVDHSVTLLEYRGFTLSTTGVLGMLSVGAYGWYASKKGHPQKTSFQHILFSLGFTIITTAVYVSAVTVAKWFAG
ncbi:hypothetical protein [Gracilimonas mengyeensis]|uniref:Uncharacterized protein n=1 Tax=Gracilimonas mengyeensis TaxID=1302730 RepID=A0A521DC38_9BACT|nr:hypothetical protein [Gracilimonas mengyeensis]SMO69206.1 hypothetical protein SAMN06265219_10818 [Gracilimonas mengyeensis]